MKPPVFDYQDPATIDEALSLLSGAGASATVLAGGQSLMPLLIMRRVRPSVLVDINKIAGLAEVVITPESVTIGAGARLADLLANRELAAALPCLRRVISLISHPQVRTRTMIGGSLSYADPAAELPALAVAMDATVYLRSQADSRSVSAADFFTGPYATVRRPDELLTAVEFARHPGLVTRFSEIARAGDFPLVGLCLGLRVTGGMVTEARAAAAGVSDRPVRLPGLELALTGRSPAAAADDAALAASEETDPPTDQYATGSYRQGALRALVRRLASEFQEAAS